MSRGHTATAPFADLADCCQRVEQFALRVKSSCSEAWLEVIELKY